MPMDAVKEQILAKALQYQFVIWDWNGTLLNDAKLVHSVNNQMLREYGLEEVSFETYRSLFTHPVKKYYEAIGVDFTKVSFEILGKRFMELYEEGLMGIDLFKGVREVLTELNQRGVRQFILSAAFHDHITSIASHFDVGHFFEEIYGIEDIYARCKKHRGHQLLKEMNLDPKMTLVIGDTDHDHEVAESLGVDILLVANGHQSKEILVKTLSEVIGG